MRARDGRRAWEAPLPLMLLLLVGARAAARSPAGPRAPRGGTAFAAGASGADAVTPIWPQTGYLYPAQPLAGKTASILVAATNTGPAKSPNGLTFQFVNPTTNEVTGVTYGMTGDITLKWPALAPLEVRTKSARFKAPANATGGGVSSELWVIADAGCALGRLWVTWQSYQTTDTAQLMLVVKYAAEDGVVAPSDILGDPLRSVPGYTQVGSDIIGVFYATNEGSETSYSGFRLFARVEETADPLPCSSLASSPSMEIPYLAPGHAAMQPLPRGLTAKGGPNATINYIHTCILHPNNDPVTTPHYSEPYSVKLTPAPTAYVVASGASKVTAVEEIWAMNGHIKAGKTMMVTVKVVNLGTVEGSAGTAGLYIAPFNASIWSYTTMTGTGNRCSKPSPIATRDLSGYTIRPGSWKIIKFINVPVPATPSPYVTAARFDLGCKNAWGWPAGFTGADPPDGINAFIAE